MGRRVLISAGSIKVFKLLRLAVCSFTFVLLQVNLYMIRFLILFDQLFCFCCLSLLGKIGSVTATGVEFSDTDTAVKILKEAHSPLIGVCLTTGKFP